MSKRIDFARTDRATRSQCALDLQRGVHVSPAQAQARKAGRDVDRESKASGRAVEPGRASRDQDCLVQQAVALRQYTAVTVQHQLPGSEANRRARGQRGRRSEYYGFEYAGNRELASKGLETAVCAYGVGIVALFRLAANAQDRRHRRGQSETSSIFMPIRNELVSGSDTQRAAEAVVYAPQLRRFGPCSGSPRRCS